MQVRVNVNGEWREADVWSGASLMSMLRVRGSEIIGVHGESGIIAAYVGQQRLDDALSLIDEAGSERIITHPDNKGMKITLSK